MSESQEIKKRARRSQIAIDRDVLQAVSSLVEEVGFSNITLTAVAERAKIEPAVFYRRYANLDELFARYTQKYDYWLSSLADKLPKGINEQETFSFVLTNLVQSLYKNKGMQQLLLWELSDDNAVTRRTAQLRELVNGPLLQLLEHKFKDNELDVNAISAVIISGIYYLVLHRMRSHFCGVDFKSKSGRKRLEDAVVQLSDLLFAELEKQSTHQIIANRLRSEGVSEELIAKCVY